MARIVYVSYDGMLEPLGQSQVLGYLQRLAATHEIHLVSFEKRADRTDAVRMPAMRRQIAESGIRWTPLRYHARPSAPATAFDILVGQLVVLYLALRHRAEILHARSYVPALMVLPARTLGLGKFVFDMRGFWADERVEGRIWPAGGRLYRMAKGLERRFFRAADHVVTLTAASRSILAGDRFLGHAIAAPITVIPTCTDLDRFTLPQTPASGAFTLGYVGSVGTGYLFDETLRLFQAILALRPEARLLVVNRNDHALVKTAVARAGVDPGRVDLQAADYAAVPALVARMNAATAFYRPSFSAAGRAPTKLGEYLGCGVPCVGNAGVGDMQTILEDGRVGVVLSGFAPEDLQTAAVSILALAAEPGIASRCRATAEAIFSLQAGGERYDGIYAGLAAPAEGSSPAPRDKTSPARDPVERHGRIARHLDRTICPGCGARLEASLVEGRLATIRCRSPDCRHQAGFPVFDGVPCLIDFESSLFTLADAHPRPAGPAVRASRLKRILQGLARTSEGPPLVTRQNAVLFLQAVSGVADAPRVLVVGGGKVGIGAEPLQEAGGIDVVASDVQASDVTDFLLDGHAIPFADGSFHGVWIQAVLEHVLDPKQVVAEIHRVLVPGGVVYAGTPFMQQVHMGAYDFHRFTQSGHRWLFRGFTEEASGVTNGAGRGLVWSIFHFTRALFGTDRFWMPLRIALGWLGRLDPWMRRGANADAASGTYFIGRRSEQPLNPRDILAYYDQQARASSSMIGSSDV